MVIDLQAQKARGVLRSLQGTSSGVQSCAFVSSDGLMRASLLGEGVDSDRFAAMCASLLALSSRAAQEVDQGGLRQVILDGEKGPMLLTRAGAGVLAVSANTDAHLGKLILDARAAAKALADIYAK